MILRMLFVVTALTLSLFAVGVATASPDEDLGRELTQLYCADCHATGPQGESPYPPAPQFRDLNNWFDFDLLAIGLVEGVVTTHPEMPEFEFDPDQAIAIIAYLRALND